MIDIPTQAEIVLRGAGFETWPWQGQATQVTCFENPTVAGFIHVFPSVEVLVNTWQANERAVLGRFAAALRGAPAKAWNIYSVFLSSERASTQARSLERIEEDFALTRKIAKAGIETSADIERALLPLLAIKAQPVLGAADFEARLRARLIGTPEEAVAALLGDTAPEEIARILEPRQ